MGLVRYFRVLYRCILEYTYKVYTCPSAIVVQCAVYWGIQVSLLVLALNFLSIKIVEAAT